jgi:pimeloyl-ACP methyl ester carboxylesterase
LVWGEDDKVVPFACHKPYVDEIKGLELLALPNAGHALQAERPTEIADRLASFIAGVRG